jgi:hypothetical protein
MAMKKIVRLCAVCLAIGTAGSALGQEAATPQEAYAKVSAAAIYLAKTGEDGIESLGNADKGFVWKDSHVWVARCESNSCIPNPRSRAAQLKITEAKCFKTGKLYILDLCDRVDRPEGAWTAYYVQDPETRQPRRMVAYMRQVAEQPFQVIASVADAASTMNDLEKISRP